jgi:hypothetical protein
MNLNNCEEITFNIFQIIYCSTSHSLLYLINARSLVISGFRCELNEICAVLGFYAASNGNFVPTFQDNLSVSSSKAKQSKNTCFIFEDGTDRLSQKVGTKLPFDAA